MSCPVWTIDYEAQAAVCQCPKTQMAVMRADPRHPLGMTTAVRVEHHDDTCPLFEDCSPSDSEHRNIIF